MCSWHQRVWAASGQGPGSLSGLWGQGRSQSPCPLGGDLGPTSCRPKQVFPQPGGADLPSCPPPPRVPQPAWCILELGHRGSRDRGVGEPQRGSGCTREDRGGYHRPSSMHIAHNVEAVREEVRELTSSQGEGTAGWGCSSRSGLWTPCIWCPATLPSQCIPGS